MFLKLHPDNKNRLYQRLIGLPGDEIQFKNGEIILNDKKLKEEKINNNISVRCSKFELQVKAYKKLYRMV